MKERIRSYLDKIEQEKNIKILLACETGSRAWGFPSPDSDYDVRLIYKHEEDWYLGLSEKKDTLEFMLDDGDIDITGWDLRKALRLLWKSNAALLERLQSPIIYKADEKFIDQIGHLAEPHYSQITTIHHYLGLAQKCLADIQQAPSYKLKTFFYALRTSVACLWIIEKSQVPPIEFGKMVDELNFDKKLKDRIGALIALKHTVNESYYHTGEEEVIAFIEKNILTAKETANNLPASQKNQQQLESFFIETLRSQ